MYIIYTGIRTGTNVQTRVNLEMRLVTKLAMCWMMIALPVLAQSKAVISPASSGLLNPHAAVFSPATGKVYVVDSARGVVNVSDDEANSTVAVKVGGEPVSIAVNTANGKAYVANAGDGTVSILDGRTDRVVATLRAGVHPYSIAVNSVTGKVYVSHTFSELLTIIDGATDRSTSIRAGSFDLIAVNSRTNTIYLLGYEGGNLAALDGESEGITQSSIGMHAWGLLVDENSDVVYAGKTGDAEIAVLKGKSGSPVKVRAGNIPGAIAFNPLTNTLYTANYGDDSVTVIDGEKRMARGSVSVGSRPEAIAVDPGSNLIFVANTHDNTVTVIDGVTNKVRGTLPAGKNPYALAFNPKSGKLHVGNVDSTSFTIIDVKRMTQGQQ